MFRCCIHIFIYRVIYDSIRLIPHTHVRSPAPQGARCATALCVDSGHNLTVLANTSYMRRLYVTTYTAKVYLCMRMHSIRMAYNVKGPRCAQPHCAGEYILHALPVRNYTYCQGISMQANTAYMNFLYVKRHVHGHNGHGAAARDMRTS